MQEKLDEMEKFRQKLMRTKTLISQSSTEGAVADQPSEKDTTKDQPQQQQFEKVLTTVDLISLGVGSCCGTGMYVVAGMVAKTVAGPSTVFSFVIAAAASILSGVCYGEFGVRVPQTSGSAYVYSYVTVGEFIAFVIGWNLILEYMIGSAAGASALSACFDALGNHSMKNYLEENVGTVIGKTYPDFVGFVICLAVTAILAFGVKNSVRVNNVLNVVNLLVWMFIMIAGMFYANGENWSAGDGFAPNGISGVFSGAATCFYAFIGFDIIATTGEEAKEPSRSIPRAILVSLVVCLIAYTSVTIMLTLIVPYTEITADSALIDMFAQRGLNGAKYVVAVGATAALAVSLLGSMFPMPRVIYAMAKDGLLFGFLGEIHSKTGTPLIATVITGVLASFLSLFVSLEVLVQMMSIGTLLAYTLVSLSVLILRYQPSRHPHQQNIPMTPPLPLDTIDEMTDTDRSDTMSQYSLDEHGKPGRFKDDQYLIPPPGEPTRSYGTLPLGSLGQSTAARLENAIAYAKRHLKIWWLRLGFPSDDLVPNEVTAKTAILFVGLLEISELVTCILIVFGANHLSRGAAWAILLLLVFLAAVCACLVFIMKQPQNRKQLRFMAPAVPFLPALATFINFYMMLKLPSATWIRLALWILIGAALYLGYSMWHSVKGMKEKLREEERLEKEHQQQQQKDQEQGGPQLPGVSPPIGSQYTAANQTKTINENKTETDIHNEKITAADKMISTSSGGRGHLRDTKFTKDSSESTSTGSSSKGGGANDEQSRKVKRPAVPPRPERLRSMSRGDSAGETPGTERQGAHLASSVVTGSATLPGNVNSQEQERQVSSAHGSFEAQAQGNVAPRRSSQEGTTGYPARPRPRPKGRQDSANLQFPIPTKDVSEREEVKTRGEGDVGRETAERGRGQAEQTAQLQRPISQAQGSMNIQDLKSPEDLIKW